MLLTVNSGLADNLQHPFYALSVLRNPFHQCLRPADPPFALFDSFCWCRHPETYAHASLQHLKRITRLLHQRLKDGELARPVDQRLEGP